MCHLNQKSFNQVVELLIPYCENLSDRQALVNSAFQSCSRLTRKVNFDGATDSFVVNLISTVCKHGECEKGTPALVTLLTELQKRVGKDKEQQIDSLIGVFNSPHNKYRLPLLCYRIPILVVFILTITIAVFFIVLLNGFIPLPTAIFIVSASPDLSSTVTLSPQPLTPTMPFTATASSETNLPDEPWIVDLVAYPAMVDTPVRDSSTTDNETGAWIFEMIFAKSHEASAGITSLSNQRDWSDYSSFTLSIYTQQIPTDCRAQLYVKSDNGRWANSVYQTLIPEQENQLTAMLSQMRDVNGQAPNLNNIVEYGWKVHCPYGDETIVFKINNIYLGE
jgi:hypothetical protein